MQSNKQYPQARLIQFAKAPIEGKVKTRLIPAIGSLAATELHQRMSAYVLSVLCNSHLAPVVLSSDDPYNEKLQRIASPYINDSDFVVSRQQGGDLGSRMRGAFLAVFEHASSLVAKDLDGETLVVLVGSDCPAIDAAYLAAAFDVLNRGSDIVLGPANDGGYVLIGMSRFCPEIFSGVDWGSAEVLQQTLSRVKTAGYTVKLLNSLADIDRPEDLALLSQLGIDLW